MRLGLVVATVAFLVAGCIQSPSSPPSGADASSTSPEGTGAALTSSSPSSSAPSSSAPSSIVPQAPPAAPDDPLHWHGVVNVTSTVYLLPWQTLRIDPGTTIRFSKLPDGVGGDWIPEADAYIKDHNDPTGHTWYRQTHFMIYGKIEAIGTKESPIRFTSAAAKPEYADWNQLVLLGGSHMENVTAEYNHNGINVQGANVILRNIVEHDSLWSCIDSYAANVEMTNIEAYHCWHQAIGVKSTAASSDVVTDAFLHDSQVSVNCEDGAQPILQDLTIRAAFLAPACGPGLGTVQIPGGADVAGGTYGGVLVYPYQG